MRTRTRIHPYVVPALARRLATYCGAKGLTESAAVEAAIEEYLDGGDKDNALILRRLNRLSRRSARQERDLEILSEAFAAFVRLWLAYRPELPPNEMEAKRRLGRQRYDQFVEIVSHRLSDSARLASDVLKDDWKNDDDADTDISAAKQQSEGG
jgi:hypothetical protein